MDNILALPGDNFLVACIQSISGAGQANYKAPNRKLLP